MERSFRLSRDEQEEGSVVSAASCGVQKVDGARRARREARYRGRDASMGLYHPTNRPQPQPSMTSQPKTRPDFKKVGEPGLCSRPRHPVGWSHGAWSTGGLGAFGWSWELGLDWEKVSEGLRSGRETVLVLAIRSLTHPDSLNQPACTPFGPAGPLLHGPRLRPWD